MKNPNPKSAPEQPYVPRASLDLSGATQTQLDQLMEDLRTIIKERGNSRPPLPFKEGWNTVSPQMSEEGLLRNVSNRRATLDTVRYYQHQMAEGQWPPTGQPIIFDTEGDLRDGQHRFLASYLGNVSFQSYIVTTAPLIDNAFAYIDNVKPRTPAAALQTAGFNGLSSTIVQVITLLELFDRRAFQLGKYSTDKRISPRMAPVQYLEYLSTHRDLVDVVHKIVSNQQFAIEQIGSVGKELAGFMGYKIEKLFDEIVAEDFLTEVGDTQAERKKGSPILWLQKLCDGEKKKHKGFLSRHQLLAYVITAFNHWKLGEEVAASGPRAGLQVDLNSPFPAFTTPSESASDSNSQAA